MGLGYVGVVPETADAQDVVTLPIPCVEGCLAVGGADMRAQTYRGGPVLVRGAECILAADGILWPARRPVVAICRCGHSQLGIYCDGTHQLSLRRPQL